MGLEENSEVRCLVASIFNLVYGTTLFCSLNGLSVTCKSCQNQIFMGQKEQIVGDEVIFI